MFNDSLKNTGLKTVALKVLRRDAFYVAGETGKSDRYFTGRAVHGGVLGMSITYVRTGSSFYQRLVVAMANAFHGRMVDYVEVAKLIAPPRQPAVAGYEQRAPAVAAPQPAANSKTSEGFVPREQVMRIVKAMMADAQVDNYKILPPSADGQPAVVWRFEDGEIGELVVLRPKSGVTLDELANISIQSAVAKLQRRAGSGPTATAILPRLGNSAR